MTSHEMRIEASFIFIFKYILKLITPPLALYVVGEWW
jgi:hypothetical protein